MKARRGAGVRRRSVLGAALGLVPALSFAQSAADYPKAGSTIRYVVPFAPGGLTDVMARSVAQQLSDRWKVSVVVDNKPGGGGQIGADLVAKSLPDGMTLLAITLAHAANVTLLPKSPFSLVKDLRPVALLAGSPMLVVVPAASPIKSFADLVAAARARPLNAGSSGNGTPTHLALALFNDISKTKIQHVPYKGGAPSITDLIGGQLDVIFSNFPESVAHVKSGKLRAIAICSAGRHAGLPDVPTTPEAGMPALLVENWTAMMAPAGTPDVVIERLDAEVIKIMQSPDVAERARTQGFTVDARPADRFGTFLNDEIGRWGRLIKAANITAE